MNLVINIKVGNEAMLTGFDAIRALTRSRLCAPTPDLCANESGQIRDVNGNEVGSWRVEEGIED